MSHVSRYSSFPVHHQENVAEHSWWVAYISLLIGEDLRTQRGIVVNVEVLLRRAITHDLSECLSGDIIRSYKHSSRELRAAMADADELNMKELTTKMDGIGAGVYYDWLHAKDDDTEGQIVAFADMVSVVIYCREEYLAGNRHISYVLREMYDRWFHKYHDSELFGKYADQLFPSHGWVDALQYEEPRVMRRNVSPDQLALIDHPRPMQRDGHD